MIFQSDRFRRPLRSASEGLRGGFWGSFWKLLGILFAVFAGGFMRQVKKCCLGLFFVANPKQLPLQKQANRTVHPLKIDDALMTVCISRHVFKTPPFFVPKAQSVASKLAYKLMFFGIRCKSLFLGALGSVWRSNLDSSWRARWRTRPPKIYFFLALAAPECFFAFR